MTLIRPIAGFLRIVGNINQIGRKEERNEKKKRQRLCWRRVTDIISYVFFFFSPADQLAEPSGPGSTNTMMAIDDISLSIIWIAVRESAVITVVNVKFHERTFCGDHRNGPLFSTHAWFTNNQSADLGFEKYLYWGSSFLSDLFVCMYVLLRRSPYGYPLLVHTKDKGVE